MKNFVLKASATFMVGMAVWGAAHAQQSGSISVGGTISPVTCKLTTSDLSKSISMGIINPSSLQSVGSTSTQKPFTLTLEGCSTPGNGHPSRASVKFSGANINTSTSNLNLIGAGTQGVASGLQARILNGNGNKVLLAAADQQVTPLDLVAGVNVMRFATDYIVMSTPVNPGRADTAVDFEITYP